MFTIVGTVILTRLVLEMFKEYKVDASQFAKQVTKPLPAIFIVVLVIFISYTIAKPRSRNKYINENTYPVAACDYILENIDLGTARFYNEYNYGSYMLFRGIPVFIDSRADVYDPQFNGLEDDIFKDFIDTSSISKYYEDTFEKYDVTHVITYKNSKMNMVMKRSENTDYTEIYDDDNFVIYERNSEENE